MHMNYIKLKEKKVLDVFGNPNPNPKNVMIGVNVNIKKKIIKSDICCYDINIVLMLK
jgi:hypothetical protein